MAYGAFKVESQGSGTKAAKANLENGEVPSFLTAMSVAMGKNVLDGDYSSPPASETSAIAGEEAEVIPADTENSEKNSEKAAALMDNPYGGAFLSYTRIITAKIPSDIASDMKTGANGSAFDYSGGGQELKITINVSGGSRIYTASGVDKNGNTFSKEIDPYSVDPTDTDYAGFATLCAYIRDTEGMADNAMQAVKDAVPEDITENGNYLIKVGFVSTNNGNLSGAKKLFEQMQSFFDKLMNLSSDSTVKGVSSEKVTSVRSDNNRIVDELQEMIQLMIQRMLNEIMGVESTEDSEADTDDLAKNQEETVGNVTMTEETKNDEEVIEDNVEKSLKLENATEL